MLLFLQQGLNQIKVLDFKPTNAAERKLYRVQINGNNCFETFIIKKCTKNQLTANEFTCEQI